MELRLLGRGKRFWLATVVVANIVVGVTLAVDARSQEIHPCSSSGSNCKCTQQGTGPGNICSDAAGMWASCNSQRDCTG